MPIDLRMACKGRELASLSWCDRKSLLLLGQLNIFCFLVCQSFPNIDVNASLWSDDKSFTTAHGSKKSKNFSTRKSVLSWLRLTRSISWLQMPWLFASPGYQQPYRPCKLGLVLQLNWIDIETSSLINLSSPLSDISRLTPIKEQLPDHIGFGAIKIVIAILQRRYGMTETRLDDANEPSTSTPSQRSQVRGW